MEEQREQLPTPEGTDETPDAIPEEAELIEIVEDEPLPTAPPQPTAVERLEAEYPDEARQQLGTLRAQLERKDGQIEQVMEAYRKTKSEAEKLRERIEKTERRRFEQSKGDFIARFVEVLDNLDRAIDSIEESFDADAVLQGIMLVRSRLVQLLKTEGLEKIFVRGQPFDPMHSEAAEMEAVPVEDQDGVVVKELQPGYMLKGSLLRAARVVVGQYGTTEEAPPPEPEARLELEDVDATLMVAPEPEAADDSWETEESADELQFSEDGLDFSKE